MLSFAHVEVAVTAKDVSRMLRSARRPGGPDIRDVQFGHGEATLRLTLPGLFALPVDVTVAVIGLHDGDLRLNVAWTNLALLPAPVKQAGLGRAVAALGLGEFWDGQSELAIPLVYIQARLAASFTVERLELTPERLLVRLRQVQAVSPALLPAEAEELPAVPEAALADSRSDASDDAGRGDGAAPFSPEQRRRYDEWRERLLQWSRSKLPPSLQAALPWVLLVPDLTVLLGRMLLDERLSPALRALLGAVLVYVLSPVDFVPDPIPVAGAIDDLSLILLTLSQLQQQGRAELVQEHWSGDGEPLRIVREGLQFLRRRFRHVLQMMQRHKVRLRRRTQ